MLSDLFCWRLFWGTGTSTGRDRTTDILGCGEGVGSWSRHATNDALGSGLKISLECRPKVLADLGVGTSLSGSNIQS